MASLVVTSFSVTRLSQQRGQRTTEIKFQCPYVDAHGHDLDYSTSELDAKYVETRFVIIAWTLEAIDWLSGKSRTYFLPTG